ncbi:hypothetical protein MSEO_30440 [Mycobacterium seoulense]|uniref:Uncharacterized protein n=1 Tax=Mycobacterium seoulense TaxID=386911 RepID=A0A7I7P1A3_9MYCO|nr:hypothetical protein MSEO_30440 [Mycobacterium seoulense]
MVFANEQVHPEFGLQRPHGAADRCRGQMQTLGCPAEVLLFSDRDKTTQVAQFHGASLTLDTRRALRFTQRWDAQNALDIGSCGLNNLCHANAIDVRSDGQYRDR